ncbi:hypothetical protein ACHHYP_00766 [Achlya hypogyna]|uniref:FYVE-type domain-containing protein n=1 Tax=Achlya hypogyna TaxID=1202772 RepID=A0A1V9ZU12_ACHHY|nr:hypothetical protein ACHHYP_00766 [Achlya hypogyna]
MEALNSSKEQPIYIAGLKDRRFWKRDDDACHVCQKYFNKYRRKHNCRVCGELVCDSCTEHKQLVVVRGRGCTTARVCFACVIECEVDDRAPPPPAPTNYRALSPDRPSFDFAPRHTAAMNSPPPRPAGNKAPVVMSYTEPSTVSQHSSNGGSGAPEWGYPWPSPPKVPDEPARLRELYKLNILDSPADTICDIMCETAAQALETSVAAISFIDQERQWFKARLGLLQTYIARHVSLCTPILVSKLSVAIPDLEYDKHFQHNPLVTGAAAIRFYAAAPIFVHGHVVGTVFVYDQYPRSPSACERARETLENVATSVELYLEDCQLSMEQTAAVRPRERRSVTFGPINAISPDPRPSTAILEDDVQPRPPSTTILESDAASTPLERMARRADRTFDSIDTTALGDMSEGTSFPTTEVLPALDLGGPVADDEEKEEEPRDNADDERSRGVLEALESGDMSLRLLDLLTISARTQQQVATMVPQ